MMKTSHPVLPSLEKELIQVAAVAVCWLECGMGYTREQVIRYIGLEREYQDEKWGAGREHGHRTWLTILIEEVGEVARELLESHLEEGA